MRKYLQLRTWPWYRLWQKVKPLLNVTRVEDEIRALEEKAEKALAELEKESELRKKLEGQNVTLLQEKNDMMLALESTKGSASEFMDKQAKLAQQKADLESQLNVSFPIYSSPPIIILLLYREFISIYFVQTLLYSQKPPAPSFKVVLTSHITVWEYTLILFLDIDESRRCQAQSSSFASSLEEFGKR